MATIGELMTDKAPGEIKVTLWDDRSKWFQPFFRTPGDWYGKNHDGTADTYISENRGWRLWEGPCCADCEKMRKERDDVVATLQSILRKLPRKRKGNE